MSLGHLGLWNGRYDGCAQVLWTANFTHGPDMEDQPRLGRPFQLSLDLISRTQPTTPMNESQWGSNLIPLVSEADALTFLLGAHGLVCVFKWCNKVGRDALGGVSDDVHSDDKTRITLLVKRLTQHATCRYTVSSN